MAHKCKYRKRAVKISSIIGLVSVMHIAAMNGSGRNGDNLRTWDIDLKKWNKLNRSGTTLASPLNGRRGMCSMVSSTKDPKG